MQKNECLLYISQMISNFVYEYRLNYVSEVNDIYFSTIYALYGYHKQYHAIESNRQDLLFEEGADELLSDLRDSLRLRGGGSLLRKFYKGLSCISHNEFEEVYVEILSEILDKTASSSIIREEFFSPSAISELIAHFVESNKCESVYDPFCGTASIVHFFNEDNIKFIGQDISRQTSIIARLNIDAHYGEDSSISCDDSISHWNQSSFDAVVSCPPINILFPAHYYDEYFRNEVNVLHDNLEELYFSRSFVQNHAQMVIALLPLSFCHAQKYRRIRQYLVDQNLLDTIIEFPDHLLYGTSIPCVLVVCRQHRNENDGIHFVNAETFCSGDARTRQLHSKELISALESHSTSIYAHASINQVVNYNYNLNPLLYDLQMIELKDEQHIEMLGNLIVDADFERRAISPNDAHNIYPRNFLKTECIDIWLSHKNELLVKSDGVPVANKVYHSDTYTHYLLFNKVRDSKPRYGIYSGSGDFMCHQGIRVMRINDEKVTPEYLIYLLVNHPVLKKGYLPLEESMMMSVAVDSIRNQKDIVDRLKQQYASQTREEQEADAKRLGVKQNISDLEHLLQTTQANIDGVLYDLEEIYPEDKNYHSLLKSLKDNVEYMKRVVRFSNTSISSEMFYFKEYDIEEFVKEYCNAWLNFSGNYFSLSLKPLLGDNKKVLFDKTYLKLMLDSILTNVERHGFKKHRSEENHVEVSLSLEKYEETPYVVIRVANNGLPFKSGFTIKDYITRGRYSANTGRSGLGGYHVYQIAKGHNGFLYLDSNKIWNVIVEVLLPINNVDVNNLPEYEHECI